MIKKITGTALLAFALISGVFGVSTNAQPLTNVIPQQEQTDKMSSDKMSSDKMSSKKKKKKKRSKKSNSKMSSDKMSGDKMKKN